MRMSSPQLGHLTYCTNIHPGESWPEVRANLGRFVPEVKRRVASQSAFGIGLRLSAAAATALADPGALAAAYVAAWKADADVLDLLADAGLAGAVAGHYDTMIADAGDD